MSKTIHNDKGQMTREAARTLEEMSFLIDSDPELIESMSPGEVENEMRAIGIDPNEPRLQPHSSVGNPQLQSLLDFQPGDTVRVHVRVKESENKERLQTFEGVVIARKHGVTRETITVRKTSFGVGVERIFPLQAPIIDHIDVVKRGRVRRAKLYYLRGLRGKATLIREHNTQPSAADAAAGPKFPAKGK